MTERSNPMKHAAAALAVIVAVAVTTAAAAAIKDPSVMILRQADIRASQYEAGDDLDEYLRTPLKAAGLSGLVATYYGTTFSKQKGFLQVSGIVLTVASPAEARRVFTITNRARDRVTRRVASEWTTVSLPSYGDQQRALIDPPGNEGIAIAELSVRKRTTVWFLHVTLERRPKPPVSELVGDLKRLAAKQKLRVGAG
jgi:hypothetical protein